MFAAKELKYELAMVDSPSGLTPLEMAFCVAYAAGARPVTAFLSVWQEMEAGHIDQSQAGGMAAAILKKPAAKRYLQDLIAKAEELGVLKIHQAQMFLTEAILTPVGEIDKKSPLCQKRTLTMNKDGSEVEIVEGINKLEALKTLARMKGWDAPIKVEHEHKGGVMLVPMPSGPGDWEAAAAASQAKLQEDAISV